MNEKQSEIIAKMSRKRTESILSPLVLQTPKAWKSFAGLSMIHFSKVKDVDSGQVNPSDPSS